jgi:hypothetical protein
MRRSAMPLLLLAAVRNARSGTLPDLFVEVVDAMADFVRAR